jgi:hypothetical protein
MIDKPVPSRRQEHQLYAPWSSKGERQLSSTFIIGNENMTGCHIVIENEHPPAMGRSSSEAGFIIGNENMTGCDIVIENEHECMESSPRAF